MNIAILDHPEWPLLREHLRVSVYDRDGGTANARHRLDVNDPASGAQLRRLLAIRVPCCSCGRMIHPVRQRQNQQGLYLAVSCELDTATGGGMACARKSSKASPVYDAIRAAVEGWEDPRQPKLEF